MKESAATKCDKIKAFAGTWKGVVTVPPNPQLPEGMTAESRMVSTLRLKDWFVLSEYEQCQPDGTRYSALGIHGWDPQRETFTFHWFDSDGWDGGAPARGEWNDDVLQLTHESPIGFNRYTYEFSGEDAYQLTMEHSPDGQEWSVILEESFHRE